MTEANKKRLVINQGPSETRIALVESGKLSELFIERQTVPSIVGNIYRAKVLRVLPGMQSAFVEIGAERTAFLYGGDVLDPEYISKRQEMFGDMDFEEVRSEIPRTPIERLIREGQEITVQVTKEPLGTKGARLSMYLAIPGRYLVVMPDIDHVGISRRIEDEETREDLKAFISETKPTGMGIIIRTAAAGAKKDALKKELRHLQKVWKTIQQKKAKKSLPYKIYSEPNIVTKVTRDIYSEDIDEIIIDHQDSHDELKEFLSSSIPAASKKLQLYTGLNPIFDEYDVEVDIGRALSRKVWLPSGGYLVIDQTEALTSFDVNTGKFVGKLSVHDTILKTNLEAVNQIVTQLKLRNIGGIIVLDFIDMDKEEHRTIVFEKLEEALRRDKARTNVLKISELGLVQMTRKRTSESLEKVLTHSCPYCDGRGRVRTAQTEAYELVRELARYAVRTGQKRVTVKVRNDIKEWLEETEPTLLLDVCNNHHLELSLREGFVRHQDLNEPAYEISDG